MKSYFPLAKPQPDTYNKNFASSNSKANKVKVVSRSPFHSSIKPLLVLTCFTLALDIIFWTKPLWWYPYSGYYTSRANCKDNSGMQPVPLGCFKRDTCPVTWKVRGNFTKGTNSRLSPKGAHSFHDCASSHDKAELWEVNQVKFIYTSGGTFCFFSILSILHEACAVTGALVCGRNSALTLLSGSYILPSIARIYHVADNRTVYVKMIRYVHNADKELHTVSIMQAVLKTMVQHRQVRKVLALPREQRPGRVPG